jgi:hypothetical protein
MKKELIKFIEKELGYKSLIVTKAIKKYFKGKEVEFEQNTCVNTKQMYIHETHTLSESNGEIYLSGDFGQIVWNSETLFTDLPHIVDLVYKSREATEKRIKEQIEEITRLVTI